MTSRELAFIRSAQQGLRAAQVALSGADHLEHIRIVIEQTFENAEHPLTNREVAYMAAMLNAWEDLGKPDLLT